MFEINPGVAIWTILTFIVLIIVLGKYGWKPILNILEAREKRIKDSLEMADQVKSEAVESLKEYKKLIDGAKTDSSKIIEKAQRDGERSKENIVKNANLEAEDILEKGRKEIALEKEQALEEIKKKSIEFSIDIASKLIATTMTPAQHKELTQKALKEITKKL